MWESYLNFVLLFWVLLAFNGPRFFLDWRRSVSETSWRWVVLGQVAIVIAGIVMTIELFFLKPGETNADLYQVLQWTRLTVVVLVVMHLCIWFLILWPQLRRGK
jgi:uncharacterized membrane protein